MKKYLSLLVIALLTVGFTACDDVPAPYGINDGDVDGGEVQPAADAEGDGTAESPFNAIAANALGKTLAVGQTTEEDYYIKGIIVSIKEAYTTQYGNATFYISVDGTEAGQFYVYRALYLGNEKYAEGQTQIEVGDEVVLCGKITNYGGTIETAQNAAYLVSLNGETAAESGGEPQPTSYILSAPFSTALTSNLGDFLTWDEQGSGYNWTYNSTYKCAYMTSYDSPSKTNHPANSWLISPAFDLTGVTAAYVTLDYKLAYASGNNEEYRVLIGKGFPGEGASPGRISWTQLPVTWTMLSSFSGASWTNTGKLAIPAEYLGQSDVRVAIQYISTEKAATWEIQNLIVAEGDADEPTQGGGGDDPASGGGGEPGDVSGESITVTAESMGASNQEDLVSYVFNEGVAWNFAQNEGTTPPRYYNADKTARLYAQNSITITSLTGQSIKAIIINASEYYNSSTKTYLDGTGNDQLSTTSGTITKNSSAKTVTITNINVPELTITNAYTQNSAGVQLRIVSMQVVWADGTTATIRRR